MGKFAFRFEQMLGISEKLKDQKQMEFGKAVQIYEQEKEKLNIIENSLLNTYDKLKETVSNKVNPQMVFEYNSYISKLKKDIEKQHMLVKNANDKVSEVRVELNNALMEIKKYEKLKEKDYEAYIEEEKQKENSFIDEIVTYKYTNKEE